MRDIFIVVPDDSKEPCKRESKNKLSNVLHIIFGNFAVSSILATYAWGIIAVRSRKADKLSDANRWNYARWSWSTQFIFMLL